MSPASYNAQNNALDALAAFVSTHGRALGSECLALLLVLNTTAEDGVCETSYADIAAALKWSRRSAIRHMAELCEAGLVERLPGKITDISRWRLSDASAILSPAQRASARKSPTLHEQEPVVSRPAPAVVVTQDSPEQEPSVDTLGAAPKAPTRRARKKPEPKPSTVTPGMEAYREGMARYPHADYAALFDSVVVQIGHDETVRWLRDWRGHNWKNLNYLGQADYCLRRGGPKPSDRASPNGNGHSSPAIDGTRLGIEQNNREIERLERLCEEQERGYVKPTPAVGFH